MRPSERRKWKSSDEPSPREKREMIERGEWEDEEDVPNRAPLIFRILAWSALIVIFFAVGYGVTSLAFRWLDSKGSSSQPDPVSVTASDAENPAAAGSTDLEPRDTALRTRQDNYVTVTISIPEGNTFKQRQIRCTNSLREDTMKQTLAAYMDAMKESKMLSAGAQDLNIFQSGDWLYLNMNGDFLESIKTLGTEKSRIMLTGMVKTMSDNFAPVNKLKFYIDGKEVRDKKPIDLTAPWGISARS
jgi:hypothetical protein